MPPINQQHLIRQNLYLEALNLHTEIQNSRNPVESQAKVEEFFNKARNFIDPRSIPTLPTQTNGFPSDYTDILRSKLASFINCEKSILLRLPDALIGNILNFAPVNKTPYHINEHKSINKMAVCAKPLSTLTEIEKINRLNQGFCTASLSVNEHSLIQILHNHPDTPIFSLNLDIGITQVHHIFTPNTSENNRFKNLHTIRLPAFMNRSFQDLFHISQWLKNLKNLKNFELMCTNVGHDLIHPNDEYEDQGLVEFAKSFEYLKTLEKLTLHINPSDYEFFAEFAKSLKHLENLKILELDISRIDNEDIPNFIESLKNLKNLEKLNFLSSTDLSNYTEDLAESLTHLKKLRVLNLHETRLQNIEPLAEALEQLQNLEELHLEDNQMLEDDDSCESLANAIRNHRHLKVLNLSTTGLQSSGLILLLNELNKLENLQSLDLSFNEFIDSEALAALAELLKCQDNLTTLNLLETGLTCSNELLSNLLPRKSQAKITPCVMGFKISNLQRDIKRTIEQI